MKHCISVLAICIMVFGTGLLYAQQPFGPAEPAADPGKVAFSLGYFYGQDKWKLDSDDFDITTNLKSKTHQLYAQLGYGLAPGWEMFVRGGVLSAKVSAEDVDVKDDGRPYGGIGIRGRFLSTKMFSLGPFANFTYYSEWKDSISTDIDGDLLAGTLKVKNHYEVNAGLAAQLKVTDKLLVYGGPFYRYAHAKLAFDSDDGSGSEKIKPKNDIGGFLGVRLPVTKNISFDVEGNYLSYFSGGLQFNYSF